MSEPKRYGVTESYGLGDMREEMQGAYVLYEDYARLKAQVEQSKRINTELLVLSERQASDIRRLTKAGDAMADSLLWGEFNHSAKAWRFARNWLAAKQGGQP